MDAFILSLYKEHAFSVNKRGVFFVDHGYWHEFINDAKSINC